MRAGRAAGLLLGVLTDSVLAGRGKAHVVGALRARAAKSTEPGSVAGRPLAGVLVVGGVVALGAGVERVAARGRTSRAVATGALAWAALDGASLVNGGTVLAGELEAGELAAARESLVRLGSRQTVQLDVVELSRVSVETIAERTVDTVVAPVFWGALAGIPGIAGARLATVLRRGAHTSLAVLLIELVHLVPTRATAALTVLTAPIVGGSSAAATRAWRTDTLAHPSPNAGRAEAAFAGALETRLGGPAVRRSGPVRLPVLGNGRNPDAGHVTRAVELSRVVSWSAACVAAGLAVLGALGRRGSTAPRVRGIANSGHPLRAASSSSSSARISDTDLRLTCRER